MEIPKVKMELNEDTVVGVHLGIAVPATCALNNDQYATISIGSQDDFLRVRTQINNQRKRLQRSLSYAKGGHGRKKKLKSLDKFKNKERHFVQTYNHMVSKRIIDFALKHHAKYINIEYLEGYNIEEFFLRNWSYYELQQYIKYKAAKYGIEVRSVNPRFTSQVCSICGHWGESQRISRSNFVCKNPDCPSHKKYLNKQEKPYFNAEFNAARNIAQSTLFIDKKPDIAKQRDWQKQLLRESKEYYDIPEDVEPKNVSGN
jgi:IS605 OrfB family transposase